MIEYHALLHSCLLRGDYEGLTLMKKIYVAELEPGMKLARPVVKDTMVLLRDGTELTGTIIRKIKNMDLNTVYIEAPPDSCVSKDELLINLERRFQNIDHEPYMDMIKRLVQEHIEAFYE